MKLVQGSLFESVRPNAGFTLFIGGGVCDVYQTVEAEKRITRQLLQLAYDYGVSLMILTKSRLVLDDLDLFKKINQETFAGVNLTITLADNDLVKIFEPGASAPEERFGAIRLLRQSGIPSGVYLMPILPFIGDASANLNAICSKAKSSGADFVHPWGLTLTTGRNKQEFFHTLEEHFPTLLPKYRLLYGNDDRYGRPDPRIAQRFEVDKPELKAYRFIYESGLDFAAKRFVPAGRIESNLKLSETLMRAAYLKKTFLNQWQEAKRLDHAADWLEGFDQDILELPENELYQLGLPSQSFTYLSELSLHGISTSLRELEKQAYLRASHSTASIDNKSKNV